MDKDYYSILGLEKNATSEEIKKAYKVLVKKYHPDINKEPGAEEVFKQIQKAYDVLGDEQKKEEYDQMGHNQYSENQRRGNGYQTYADPRNWGAGFQQVKIKLRWYHYILFALLAVFLLLIAVIWVIVYAVMTLIRLIFGSSR